jgi:acetyl esterase/lipase
MLGVMIRRVFVIGLVLCAAVAYPHPVVAQVPTDEGERVSRQTEIFPGDPSLPSTVTVLQDVVYGSPKGRDLHLDLILRKAVPSKPRPAIVFIHGGSWKFGDKSQFRRQAAWLADRLDIVGACIEYRLSGEAQFPAALQDAKCAVRWVRSVAQPAVTCLP